MKLTTDLCSLSGSRERGTPGLYEDSLAREAGRLSLRQVGAGREEGSRAEPSLFWWRLADKALLSGTRGGSHEWLCKQPKREGTFPLAESAVKRFPVTVIAAFGGIVSVVGGQGKGAGWPQRRGASWAPCRK